MTPEEPQTYGWRIRSLEERTQRLEAQDNAAAIQVMDERVKTMALRMGELHEDLIWLKRALLGAILSLLGGMILFLFSIAAGWLG